MAVSLFTLGVSCKNGDKGEKGETKTTETKPADDVVAKNMEAAKKFYADFEKADWAAIEALVEPGFTDHSSMMPPGTPFTKDTLMKYLRETKQGFPDMKLEALNMAGNGDILFVHYKFSGTNSGSYMGMPATNKKVEYMGVDLLRMKDGKAAEHWDYGDNITFMRQMGMMPEQ